MSQRLKRWESPRREGRNDKGRGGSARQRQKQKQMKLLRQRLKPNDLEKPQQSIEGRETSEGGETSSLPFLFALQTHSDRFLPSQIQHRNQRDSQKAKPHIVHTCPSPVMQQPTR
jgi:hypothetical protein